LDVRVAVKAAHLRNSVETSSRGDRVVMEFSGREIGADLDGKIVVARLDASLDVGG
jgi:hypothetical protein